MVGIARDKVVGEPGEHGAAHAQPGAGQLSPAGPDLDHA